MKLLKSPKFWILLIIVAVLGFLEYRYNLRQYLTPEQLETFINQFGVWAPLVFMLIYYVLVLLFVSAAAFTILAGILFGPLWGSIYVIVAATAAAQTAFFISRYFGKGLDTSLLEKKGIGPLMSKIEKGCEKDGFKNFFIMRCLFLPYIPLSYAAGLIQKAKARDFFFATLFTNMIFTPAFVFFGDSLLKGPKALLLPVILIVLVLAVPRIIKKFQKNA